MKKVLFLVCIAVAATFTQKAAAQAGAVKIAYVSALRQTQADEQNLFKNKGVIGFLEKPLDIKFFTTQVKKLLDNTPAKLRKDFQKNVRA